jgi:hypothetical protein
MFGLKKLTFKTKVIIVSMIAIIISMSIVYLRNAHPITVVKINDWVFVLGNAKGDWYYKLNSINTDKQTHIMTVWVKIVYTDKGKQEFLKTHKIDKYADIDRSLSLLIINIPKMKYYEDRVVYYSKSDNIIGSDELSIKRGEFIPKSVADKLLIKFIENYNIKR